MPEPTVPPDLRKALATTPGAKAAWSDLTPIARRDFLSWVAAAKLPETAQPRGPTQFKPTPAPESVAEFSPAAKTFL